MRHIKWLVLVELAHNSVREPGHVFADHEREVATLDELVVDDSISDLFAGPLSVHSISQDVGLSHVHSSGNVDVL